MAKKTQEEIQQSIEKATREWQERKIQQEEYSKFLKKGLKFCKENEVKYLYFFVGDYYITLGYYVSKSGIIHYSYAICSPRDDVNSRIAEGLIGNRFLENEYIIPNVILSINDNYRVSDYEIQSICEANFKYLLEVEAEYRNTIINAPRKLINYVNNFGVCR